MTEFKCLNCNRPLEERPDAKFYYCSCGWITEIDDGHESCLIERVPNDVIRFGDKNDLPWRSCYPILFERESFSLDHIAPSLTISLLKWFKGETLTRRDKLNVADFLHNDKKINFGTVAKRYESRAQLAQFLRTYFYGKKELKNDEKSLEENAKE